MTKVSPHSPVSPGFTLEVLRAEPFKPTAGATPPDLTGRAGLFLAGAITKCTEDILAQVRSVVYQRAQPLATRKLSLVHSTLGIEAGLIGGMISGIEQVLSPRGTAYHTRPADSAMQPLGV